MPRGRHAEKSRIMTNDYQPYPNVYAIYFVFPLLSLYISRFDHERLRRPEHKHPIDAYTWLPPKWSYPIVWTALYVLMSISIFTVYLLAYDMPEWMYFTIHATYYADFFLNKFWVWCFFDYRWYGPATGFTLTLLILSSLYVVQCFFIASTYKYVAIALAFPLVLWEVAVTIIVGIVASYEDSAIEKAREAAAKLENIAEKQDKMAEAQSGMLETLKGMTGGWLPSISSLPETTRNPPHPRPAMRVHT